jgi:hypothetical protein
MHQLKAKAGADATRNANEQMQVSLRVATIALNTFLGSNSYAPFEREIALTEEGGGRGEESPMYNEMSSIFFVKGVDGAARCTWQNELGSSQFSTANAPPRPLNP